jgi:translation initiation factor IF-2
MDEEVKKTKLTLNRSNLFKRSISSNTSLANVSNVDNFGVKVEIKAIGLKTNTRSVQNLTTDKQDSERDKKINLLKNARIHKNMDLRSNIPELSIEEDLNNDTSEIQIGSLSLQKESNIIVVEDEINKGQSLQKQLDKKDKQIKYPPKTISVEALPEEKKAKIPLKAKMETEKKFNKSNISQMLSEDSDFGQKTRSLSSIKRARDKEKRKMIGDIRDKIFREVVLPEIITVSELADRMSEQVTVVIREFMKLGVLAAANQAVDVDTAELVIDALGHTCKRVKESDIEDVLQFKDEQGDLKFRAPVVTIMGHVDHGKTSLLDALRKTDIVSGEFGGITQHIGAYNVMLENGKSITFIDTPGHEAFSNMRSRGVKITDIVVLVVAADDSIKTQTIESINQAKAANLPIIVAINKIDKPDANIEKVKNDLLQYSLISEELGGDTLIVPISAKQSLNLDKLEEAILLQSDLLELKARYDCHASGVVIESRIDKGRGVAVTLIIQRGTLKIGDIVVAGTSYGRVKTIINDRNIQLQEALPSYPVEIFGIDLPPQAGSLFSVVEDEKTARDIAEYRLRIEKDKKLVVKKKANIEDIFADHNSIKEISFIVKGDVHSSIEAIKYNLQKIPQDKISINIIHSGVGQVTESDILLANTSSSIILAFNVKANRNAIELSERASVKINYYSIIYELIEDVRQIAQNMLEPLITESYTGRADVREIFNISGTGIVAGSYITNGSFERHCSIKLIRDKVVIYEGKLKTIKRFKEDTKEVKEGYECGLSIEYKDIKQGDIIEGYKIIETKQVL